MSADAEAVEITAAVQPGAKAVSPPKTSAKDAIPTSMINDEARLKLREKNILSINPLRFSAGAEYSLPGFFCG